MTKESPCLEALEKIKNENIKPKPKWQFTMRNIFYVAVFSLFVIIISICVSILIHMLINNDWDMLSEINPDFFGFIFITFPYLWLGLFGLFMVAAYLIFRKFQCAYRFRIQHVLFVFMVAGLLAGTMFYYIGLGKTIELGLRDTMPFYRHVAQQQQKPFVKPEQGVLTGRVIEIINDQEIIIEDPYEQRWRIVVINGFKTERRIKVQLNLPVIIQGEMIDENTFKANLIRTPMKGRFMLMQAGNQVFYYNVKEI